MTTISVLDAVADEKQGYIDFVVRLSAPSDSEVSVNYGTSPVTTDEYGADNPDVSGELTFAAGETVKTVRVLLTDDKIAEKAEGFAFSLNSAVGASIYNTEATGTIYYNDSATTASATINGGFFADLLNGTVLADTINGNENNDIVIGDQGNDTLTGGIGKDIFVFGTFGQGRDQILDFAQSEDRFDLTGQAFTKVAYGGGNATLTYAGGQIDIVNAPKLSLDQWNALLTGMKTLNGTSDIFKGNASADSINGAGGNDTLSGVGRDDLLVGGAGDDRISGGTGVDRLYGGAGKDTFVFDVPSIPANSDTVFDFVSGQDKIAISRGAFKAFAGAAAGALAASDFVVGTSAKTAAQHLIYDSKTGVLLYDVDGSGTKEAVQIALLGGHPALSVADIVLI